MKKNSRITAIFGWILSALGLVTLIIPGCVSHMTFWYYGAYEWGWRYNGPMTVNLAPLSALGIALFVGGIILLCTSCVLGALCEGKGCECKKPDTKAESVKASPAQASAAPSQTEAQAEEKPAAVQN